MKIEVEKITDEALMREACSFTINAASNMSLEKIYRCEHSPMRTQLFVVRMYDIPTFVSVHFVRHTQGVQHYVKSNRDDRGGDKIVDRNSPVNHMMLCNAQALINMARKRLCYKAHKKTRAVMMHIRDCLFTVDLALANSMVRECEYRKGCYEIKSCGLWRG